jgi:hypothetical protein
MQLWTFWVSSHIYRVSQEECARLRESVPYGKVYQYNPKHLYPKLNSYGEAYIQRGVAWFPKENVYDIAISTPVPCSLWHDTFNLGLGRPEPLASQCRCNPHQGIPSTTVTASHVTQGSVQYKSTIPRGTDKGLDLWEVHLWLGKFWGNQDRVHASRQMHSQNCASKISFY